MSLDPQAQADQVQESLIRPIRLLGGPRHNKQIADYGEIRFIWNGHLYLRTKITLFSGKLCLCEWSYLYFGLEDAPLDCNE